MAADDLVRLTGAATVPEAEMMRSLLADEGIPVVIRDLPGYGVLNALSPGPRVLLVRREQLGAARELVESHFGLDRPFA
jgi:hypothetical protein